MRVERRARFLPAVTRVNRIITQDEARPRIATCTDFDVRARNRLSVAANVNGTDQQKDRQTRLLT